MTTHKNYPWLIVFCYSILGVCFPAAVTQFSMSVASIAQELAVPERTILLADTFRAICLVCGMFLSTLVYKRLGLRRTILLGISFQVLPQFLIPMAVSMHSLPLLYLFKGMQGLNSVAFPLYIFNITSWIQNRSKGLATAIFNGSFSAGAGVGAWISGQLIPLFGWRFSFYVLGGCCLVLAVPALLITREKPQLAPDVPAANAHTNDADARYRAILTSPVTWVLVSGLLAYTWVSQSVTVDMSVYSVSLGYSYGQTGNLMLMISAGTVFASIMGGAVSDWFAARASNKLRSRTRVLSLGYLLSATAALLLPMVAGTGFAGISIAACAMMLGTSWVQGVFWAIPSEVYTAQDSVAATSICSGTSNLVNPLAPMVVGVVLGANGMWQAAWLTCAVASALSLCAILLLPRVFASAKRTSTFPKVPKQQPQ